MTVLFEFSVWEYIERRKREREKIGFVECQNHSMDVVMIHFENVSFIHRFRLISFMRIFVYILWCRGIV